MLQLTQIIEIARAALAEYEAQVAGKPEAVRVFSEATLADEELFRELVATGAAGPGAMSDMPEQLERIVANDFRWKLAIYIGAALNESLNPIEPETPAEYAELAGGVDDQC